MSDYTRKMTYERAEKARALYKDGYSAHALCEIFSLSYSAMRDILRGKSWVRENTPVESSSIEIPLKIENKWDTVYNLWVEGKTQKEIADCLGITKNYVSLILWAVRCARKDPNWVKNRDPKMTKWAHEKVAAETKNEEIHPAPPPTPPAQEKAESLKSCPFCGGHASLWYNTGKYGRFTYAECDVCGARSKAFQYYSDETEYNPTEIGAIRAADAWNRRR